MGYELDYYQKQAVFGENRNTIVIAAPGSGKTTVIVNRLVYLIEKVKISTDNIAVITFTKTAAENMKKRYLELSSTSKTPFFGTMHSLFYKILKEFYTEINIINEKEAYGIIYKVLHTYLENISEEKVKEVLNNISLYKNSLNFKSTIDNKAFTECLKCYEGYKKTLNLMDFDDLQLCCKQLFEKDRNMLEKYRGKIKYLLIDEFQDCDELQLQIIKMLNYDNYIFAVGDEDQSIYGFRGSKPEYMVNFNKLFINSRSYFLSTNYRSPKNIVEVSNKIISNNLGRNKKHIISKKTYSEEIQIIFSEDEEEEAESISKILKTLEQNNDNIYDNTAIIYRNNCESSRLADLFIRKNIKFYFLNGEYNFFNHFICKDLISYIKLSINCCDGESFIRIANKPYRFISKLSIERLKRETVVREVYSSLCGYNIISNNQIKVLMEMKKKVNKITQFSINDAVNYIWNRLLYKDYIKSYCEKNKVDIENLKNIVNEFISLGKYYKTLGEYIKHIAETETVVNSNTKIREGVKLSTIHGVKGMEFNNVFIINCNEGNLPYLKDKQCNLEEERRLFYVAMTRTKEKLYICYNKKINGINKQPSIFLREGHII